MSAAQQLSRSSDSGYETMQVRPIAGALGAEIHGVNLKDRDNLAMWAELRRAFLEHQVIAVRGQNLTPEDPMNVGRFFGEPRFYPFAKGMEGHPHMTRTVKEPEDRHNFGADWHTDTCYLKEPPRAVGARAADDLGQPLHAAQRRERLSRLPTRDAPADGGA